MNYFKKYVEVFKLNLIAIKTTWRLAFHYSIRAQECRRFVIPIQEPDTKVGDFTP